MALIQALFTTLTGAASDAVSTNLLPPVASVEIDFTRDIKPIFEASCLKCHGPEKPKSGFQLTSREAALKGGREGVDIIPGNSARSPLIHFVAGLVEDMTMPPEGRGERLTPEQIGLLRAWIDQGVAWDVTPKELPPAILASPTLGWITVKGDSAMFREMHWQQEGWNGGGRFELYKEPEPDVTATLKGQALVNDYRLVFTLTKAEVGFTRFGWEQFRKYYDDTGGYYPLFTPPGFSLDRDLYLDLGRAWVDVGLTKPDWPLLTLGYEYQYRDGSKSTLQWGAVSQGNVIKNIFPAFEDVSEEVNIIKFDLDYEFHGVRIEDNFRAEFYDLTTKSINNAANPAGSPVVIGNSQDASHFQGANTLRLEKQFTDWLFASGGYLYSKLDGNATENLTTVVPVGVRPVANQINLDRQSQVVSLSLLLGPWQGLQLSTSVQSEWLCQSGFNDADAEFIIPGVVLPSPVNMYSDINRTVTGEDVSLRFTKIPFTTLYAEGRWQQDSYGQFEQEDATINDFLRNTEATGSVTTYRFGFNTSPWRRISWSGHYLQYDRQTDYNHTTDQAANPFAGYSAFIRYRQIYSQKMQTKLTWRANSWLQTSFGYQWLSSQYHTTTDPLAFPPGAATGLEQLDGNSEANIFSLGATLIPVRKLYLNVTFAYQKARMTTVTDGPSSIAPDDGNVWSVLANGNYALNPKTDLLASYAYNSADFQQNNLAGLPLGANYEQHAVRVGIKRTIKPGFTAGVQYGFYYYNDPGNGGLNNYQAHAVFANLSLVLP